MKAAGLRLTHRAPLPKYAGQNLNLFVLSPCPVPPLPRAIGPG